MKLTNELSNQIIDEMENAKDFIDISEILKKYSKYELKGAQLGRAFEKMFVQPNGFSSNVSMDELEAIYKQCQELDWVDEKICTNFTDPTSDYFICSNCGIYLEDFSQTVIGGDDKRNVNQDGYELRYCPNCGCKIVDYDHFVKKQNTK